MSSIFSYNSSLFDKTNQPFAERMRPRNLSEFIGQSHILAEGKLLRRAIEADRITSLLFYGPPGTGKTTLARVIANSTKAEFLSINAVLSGIADIRHCIEQAKIFKEEQQKKTILFIDEVHRFNKAQQDALLPHVEQGTLTLIGATTENPYFEVNKALVSRSRIFALQPLTDDELKKVLYQALNDSLRGFGGKVSITQEAVLHLIQKANGDARSLLNALELAVITAPDGTDDSGKPYEITLEIAADSIQQKAVLYDKDGDSHFDTISAFIKSVRGSDPDAALYWLARMLTAGESPRFLFRRMIILAAEDVGLADPQALQVVMAAAQAFEYIGLPEGRFVLSQACLYLATAPKSNTTFSFFDALRSVEEEKNTDIPNPLKDASRDKEEFDHGKGYLYPHAYRDHWVAQQYLPDGLVGRIFYQPSDQGEEGKRKVFIEQKRDAQLEALQEINNLTTQNTWYERAFSTSAEALSNVRDILFTFITKDKYATILNCNASSGLIIGELLRRLPKASIYAHVLHEREQQILETRFQSEQSNLLSIVVSPLLELEQALAKTTNKPLLVDQSVGRQIFNSIEQEKTILTTFYNLLTEKGSLVLAQTLQKPTLRFTELLEGKFKDPHLRTKLETIESRFYQQEEPQELLKTHLETNHFHIQESRIETISYTVSYSISNWRSFFFQKATPSSFAATLQTELTAEEKQTLFSLIISHYNTKAIEQHAKYNFIKAQKI